MDFDLAVIGTGIAARTAAMQVRKSGWSVAVIDDRPIGGTCVLRGCDPKKMLLAGADVVDAQRQMRPNGVDGEVRIDWPRLIAFKRSFTDPIPAEHEKKYTEAGIATFPGAARFTGPNSLSVEDMTLRARRILIASGAEPVKLDIAGEGHLLDHEAFMTMERLPRRIVMVGGGYIAAEFSHLAARAGAEVTVLQRAGRMLTRFEPELVGWLMESFDRVGIEVRTKTVVKSVEKTGDIFVVHADGMDGSVSIEADAVVHAGGRAPALERLDLAAADVATKDGKLQLNDFLQSVSNPAVYAAGDAAQVGPPLTPVSSLDAKIVADNLASGNHARPDYRGIPSVAFTIPRIAAVGMSEEQARRSGAKYRVKCQRTSDWFTAIQAAEPVYGFKTLVEEGSGRILGAHLVGPQADEVINLFGMAVRHELTAGDLKSTIFAYPTGASDISHML